MRRVNISFSAQVGDTVHRTDHHGHQVTNEFLASQLADASDRLVPGVDVLIDAPTVQVADGDRRSPSQLLADLIAHTSSEYLDATFGDLGPAEIADLLLARRDDARPDPDAPEFFRPGVTYADYDPFRAPESSTWFSCVAVARHPTKGAMRAFGFARSGRRQPWRSVAFSSAQWGDGWQPVG